MVRSVFADGTRAANWKKRRLRYVAVFGQLSDKRRLEPCATVHRFRPIGYVRKEAAVCEGSESDVCLWPDSDLTVCLLFGRYRGKADFEQAVLDKPDL